MSFLKWLMNEDVKELKSQHDALVDQLIEWRAKQDKDVEELKRIIEVLKGENLEIISRLVQLDELKLKSAQPLKVKLKKPTEPVASNLLEK
jgi:hypothetical protein